jgi:hypothetical protein
MTKYCKDCKYCVEEISFWCEHPSIPPTAVDNKPVAMRCAVMRDSDIVWAKIYKEIPKLCGPSAKLYDPKLSLLQKLANFFQPAPKV